HLLDGCALSLRLRPVALALRVGLAFAAAHLLKEPDHDQHAAKKDPACVSSNIPALHVSKAPAGASNNMTDTVDGAVDHQVVHNLPQEFPGNGNDRPDDDHVVKLVHVIAIHHDGIQCVKFCDQLLRQSRFCHIEEVSERKTYE